MNRLQRRAMKSKKKARFRGLNKKQVLTPDSWRQEKIMDITYGYWLFSIIVVMFFLGGEYSPLWVLKSYRKFINSIGLGKD